MRGGQLLAEDTPSNLLVTHEAETLEQVFLTLCQVSLSSEKGNSLLSQLEEVRASVRLRSRF